MLRVIAVLTLLTVLGAPVSARAHFIPDDAKIQIFMKPEGTRLRVVIRAPLTTMVDIEYPTRGPENEYVDLDRADFALRELTSLWLADKIAAYEGNQLLAYPAIRQVRASLPLDASFISYDQALAHMMAPRLTNSVDFVWNQGLLDALLEYQIVSPESRFSIHSTLSSLALRTTTQLKFLQPSGGILAFEFTGDPGLIHLDPTRSQAAARFSLTAALEIARGLEYWLFLLALALPFQRMRAIVPVVLASIAAESIALTTSARFAPDTLWFQPLISLLIAVAIVYMSIENGLGLGSKRRWMMAFGFGLVLGFRFSATLGTAMQYAGTHPSLSLFSFGVGVAVAQCAALALLVAAVRVLFKLVPERGVTIVMALMAGDIAWHWLLDRGSILMKYQFQWPGLTPAMMLTLVTWTMNVIVACAVFWLLRRALQRFKVQAETGTSIQ